MRKKIAVAAMSAGLIGGAAAATVFTPMISGAQTTPSTQAPSPSQNGQNGQAGQNGQPPQDRQQKTKDALQELVASGVINQSQADAVLNKLQSIGPPNGARGGPGGGHRGPKLDVAAQAIGITTDQLQQELQTGTTLADVAKAHNVDPQKVIDAMVADGEKHLADEVASGKVTQAEADQRKADLVARVTERVNSTKPAGGPGHGKGGPDGQTAPSDQGAPSQTPTTPGTGGN